MRLGEDEEPQKTPIVSFDELDDPLTEPFPQSKGIHEKREKTRAYYGYILLAALVCIYGFSMTIYSLDLTSTAARMDHLMTTIVTYIQTLVASVIGFYFGSERK